MPIYYRGTAGAENDEKGFNSMAGLFLFLYSIIALVAFAFGIGLTFFTTL